MIKQKFRFHVTSSNTICSFTLILFFFIFNFNIVGLSTVLRVKGLKVCVSWIVSQLSIFNLWEMGVRQYNKRKKRDYISFYLSRNFIFQYFIIPSCLPTFLYLKRQCKYVCLHDCREKRTPTLLRIHTYTKKGYITSTLNFCSVTWLLLIFILQKCDRTLATHPLWHEAKASLYNRNNCRHLVSILLPTITTML